MKPRNLSINGLARHLDVPPNRICAIINGERSVTADTALRLARCFGTTPEFWLHAQARHDLKKAVRDQEESLKALKPLVDDPVCR